MTDKIFQTHYEGQVLLNARPEEVFAFVDDPKWCVRQMLNGAKINFLS
jgi:hypothetical protein